MPNDKLQPPKLFDIHSHLNFSAFRDDADKVIKRILKEKIWTILVGSQSSTSQRAVEYAEKYCCGIYAAVGLHPIHLEKTYFDPKEDVGIKERIYTREEEFDYSFYKNLAQKRKVVAIGESGLDYYRCSKSLKKKQIEIFEKHIELAIESKKPLMVHCREGHRDSIDILRKFKAKAGNNLLGDIHFFSGSWEEAKKYFDLDFSISFTGVITFTSAYDEVVKKSPIERIMIETDAPYVAPIPYRGRRNEPLYVAEICRKVAKIKNISFEKAAKITVENALRMFKIKKPDYSGFN
jgi:TatD DNase family protein